MAWFTEVQEAIRSHAAEHIANPFVKVDPQAGSAIIWTKGAKDAWKFASVMHKSFFLGRKIVAVLCRKPKPYKEAEEGKVAPENSHMDFLPKELRTDSQRLNLNEAGLKPGAA